MKNHNNGLSLVILMSLFWCLIPKGVFVDKSKLRFNNKYQNCEIKFSSHFVAVTSKMGDILGLEKEK
jgi:hypothetical protein